MGVRRVAADLGVTPMALYRHVPSREQLLLHLLDLVADGVEVPGPGPPRDQITAAMLAVHRAFRGAGHAGGARAGRPRTAA